jgi:bifunctional non-homologous end joining protein LigD
VSRNAPPAWIRPQLALLVKEAPAGPEWLHGLKLDGYRPHRARDVRRPTPS